MPLALRFPRIWSAIAALALALTLAVGTMVALPAPASANTKSNWSKVVSGIEIGWTKNHGWMIASYATLLKVGSGRAAQIVCTYTMPEEPGLGYACNKIVSAEVAKLTKGKKRVTNHGVWVAAYPSISWGVPKVTMQGGTY